MLPFLLAVLAPASPAQSKATAPAAPVAEKLIDCGAPIARAAVDAAGNLLVVALDSGELRGYRLDKREQVWTVAPQGEDPAIRAVTTLAVGQRVSMVTRGGLTAPESIDLRDGSVNSGYMMLSIPGAGPIAGAVGMTVDSRDRWAWLAVSDGVLARYTPAAPKAYNRRSLKGMKPTAIASDDKLVAIGCDDGSIHFADASSASVDDKKVLESEAGAITALGFVGQSGLLAAASRDGSVRVWTIATGKTKHTLPAGATVARALVGHPKGKWLAAGGEAGLVRVWSADKLVLMAEMACGDDKPSIRALEVVDDGQRLLVARGGPLVVAYDLPK